MQDAVATLQTAGAVPPATMSSSPFRTSMAALADSVKKGVPMIYVPDVARALEWYASIGFREIARYAHDGLVDFGIVSFGKAELMLNMHGQPGPHNVSLWFYTDRVDDLYQLLKSRQLEQFPFRRSARLQPCLSKPKGLHYVSRYVETETALEAAQSALAGEPDTDRAIEFEQDIDDMFYGARQFGIRDLNGYQLYFIQSRIPQESSPAR